MQDWVALVEELLNMSCMTKAKSCICHRDCLCPRSHAFVAGIACVPKDD